jgi:hypothetical protein
MTDEIQGQDQTIRNRQDKHLLRPDLPSRLIQVEGFSDRIRLCRIDCLAADGRFTREQIAGISTDEFDHRSLHGVATLDGVNQGVIRVTSVREIPTLPFQHFYPSFTEDLLPGDAEISKFVILPEHRAGKTIARLVEAGFRFAVMEGAQRLFIDVVDGNFGVNPKSYEKHFGFQFTGHEGFDDNYGCKTHLMVLEGAINISEMADELTARQARYSRS